MSLILKGIDLPKGARYADISFLDKFGMPVGDEYIEEAIQIPKDDEEAIDILMKVRQGIREGEER